MQTPRSTYRIQLNASFNLSRLGGLGPYLKELGISTIYAAPLTHSIKGSSHGYDVTDPRCINPEIGTEEELAGIAGWLAKNDMGWLQDIVPNHMAYNLSNSWLYDVLERGRDSEYASWFDIRWDHPLAKDRLMAPFLGKEPEECIEAGEIKVRLADGDEGFVIAYADRAFPVSAKSLVWICSAFSSSPPELTKAVGEWAGHQHVRKDDWKQAKKVLIEKIRACREWEVFVERALEGFNERPALLRELLDYQHYRLTHSKGAGEWINYRRFFTVNSLICLRMEEEDVYNASHEWILSLYRKGYIQGLRIDHIDGLAAPRAYIERLKKDFGPGCYLVAEKILGAEEELPEDWTLEGTTGYEFLAAASQLLTDPRGAKELREFYQAWAPEVPAYRDLIYAKKYEYLRKHMNGELDNLVALYKQEDSGSPGETGSGEDSSEESALKEALAILMACFPVYRIYPDEHPLPAESRRIIRQAFREARQRGREYEQAFGRLETLFFGTSPGSVFLTRLMQFTGPLAAKGIEDTCFYVYNPLISHNEVGDTPGGGAGGESEAGGMGISVYDFHQKMIARHWDHPYSLNTGSTHDTKRGEDARIRLNMLSAFPGEWKAAVTQWREINAMAREMDPAIPSARDSGVPVVVSPTPNTEYFLYQSLLAGFPQDLRVTDDFRERFRQAMLKSLREAGTETSWDEPDGKYEKACFGFMDRMLTEGSLFLEAFRSFAGMIIEQSAIFSLSHLLLKLTAPGIPDIYQGSELFDLSYVDPDNRRPVDYDERRRWLECIGEERKKGMTSLLDFLAANRSAGVEKLYVLVQTLACRNRFPELFGKGDYIPVDIPGDQHIAYMRRRGKDQVLVVAPLIRKKKAGHEENPRAVRIRLPEGSPIHWKNEFTGEEMALHRVPDITGSLSRFPVALFVSSCSYAAISHRQARTIGLES